MDRRPLNRHDHRIIIHFDYDCFYASVFEAENPTLKSLPLAVQQKQIIVTCNYEARRRGLYKLQLITEAKKVCPDVIIVLGEDLTRFRDASKRLYTFLRDSIWSDKVERLGFDEVFLDCTDMVEYNLDLLNVGDLSNSFFCLDKQDPTVGFGYDASHVFGPTFPADSQVLSNQEDSDLRMRLILGSHLARHIRHSLEYEHGYTATVGVSTNKLLAKLVGNVNKPKNQTTLMPPYLTTSQYEGNPILFMDSHEIGKVPGIGFKLSQKIRALVLGRPAAFESGLVYGGTRENVSVKDVRLYPAMNPGLLEDTLSGPGSQKGIGGTIWALLHGVDDADVSKAKKIPTQISIEDSYIRLDTIDQVRKELLILSRSLINRMHLDLTEEDLPIPEGDPPHDSSKFRRRWLAHPRVLRLSTRPRPPLNPDGTRPRTFNRISRSCPMPNYIFSLNEPIDSLAERLVNDTLWLCFRKLHPEKSGWNLSLVNIACTNMTETAADTKDSQGRDIGVMFQRQEKVLKEWEDLTGGSALSEWENDVPEKEAVRLSNVVGDVDAAKADELARDPDMSHDADAEWNEDDDEGDENDAIFCPICYIRVPLFAVRAHLTYHDGEPD